MPIEELINTGIAIIGDDKADATKPVVVVGPPRSGTSMVAGALHHLGLFMGHKATPPVYEDVHLSNVFESGDDRRTREVIKSYLKNHGRFGWKRPESINQLERVDELFGKPNYLFIFKDIFAIANRNRLSMASDLLGNMQYTAERYLNATRFINARRPRAMLLSYEKVMLNPESFVSQVAHFCGLENDPVRMADALEFIDPFPQDYLEKSRIHRAHGRLVNIDNNGLLRGWARYVYQKSRQAVVDIYLNDNIVASVNASESTKDFEPEIADACGFSIMLDKNLTPRVGDVIRARVRGDVRDLDNSPYQVH